MDILEILGVNVRIRRKKLKFTQMNLSEVCGLKRSYISSVERFERNITLSNLDKLAQALQVKPHQLLVMGKNFDKN